LSSEEYRVVFGPFDGLRLLSENYFYSWGGFLVELHRVDVDSEKRVRVRLLSQVG
jgi:hypothetical protein